MTKPLRLLIVEDSEDDAILLLAHLSRAGWHVTHRRVQTAQALKEAMEGQNWDIVVADHSMPQFTGFDALGIVRQIKSDLPFILVSGAVGEETAVAAMKAGANDYLFKGNLARLVPAVERELSEAAKRRASRQAQRELQKAKSDLAMAEGLAAANAALKWEITQRQEAQRALQELNNTLERRVAERTVVAESASRAKSDFLANMSHEIRTPLTAIVGFAEMLLRPNLPSDERTECAKTIRRNSKHLLDLINDILDLSKIEAGKMTVERTKCDFPGLIGDVASIMRPRAMEKALEFAVAFEGPIPRQIETDPLRLRQILMNLLGNAIKFTSAGKITLRIQLFRSSKGHVLSAEVTDTGIGMNQEQLQSLFERFSQADTSAQRKFGGTGLGLAISRKLARLLGGDITAVSQAGSGSTFTLKVDCGKIAKTDLIPRISEADLHSSADATPTGDILVRGKILLVEDGRDNQRLLTSHLQTAGAQVVVAENGRKALEIASTQRFDLVLMDMQMPEMDGYTATAELRRRGFRVPIVALTAHAMSEDRAKCIESGCTDYLTKPIGWETLIKTVAKYLGVVTTAKLPAPPQSSEPSEPKNDSGNGKIQSSLAHIPRMKKIIAEFLQDLPGDVEKMLNLLQGKELSELKTLVHQLRGAGGGYGFDSLSELAQAAEESILAADNLQTIRKKINELINMIRHIEGYDESKEAMATSQGAAA
jgi:signal transduction histidine kinase/HPt (histidine-containing phosphotransfer) domain-containing protein